MGVINYAINRLKHFNIERFKKHMQVISQNTGKPKLYIALDWIANLFFYGVSYTDYFRGNFISLKHKEKKTFVTASSFYKILNKLNDKEESKYLSDKIKFNNRFKEFIKRDFIDLRESDCEEFKKFVNEKGAVIAKILNGYGGHEMQIIRLSDNLNLDEVYNELIDAKRFLVEELIIQSDELNEINPYSVSSFRVVTLYNEGKVHVLGNALRVNQGKDQVVGCTEDLYFSLDEEGKISSNVIDDYGNIYEEHPLTKKKFSEVKISGVKEAFEMCMDAASLIPRVRYIGWDIAFSKNGPCIMEGNEFPGYGVIQFYKLNGSRTGHKKQIEDIIGKI